MDEIDSKLKNNQVLASDLTDLCDAANKLQNEVALYVESYLEAEKKDLILLIVKQYKSE